MLHWIESLQNENILYYSILLHSQAESHHSVSYLITATWWTNSTIYIPEYTPVLISTCRIEFNHYKREFTLLQYSKTLSSIITSFCIIFDNWYMMNQQHYIYSRILQVLFQHTALNLITTKREFTVLQYSTALSSIIALFCITFDNCYMMNQQHIYILVYSQYWYQHAVINLFSTRREFTLLEYSTTLSSLITSFCIIFDICNMMKLPFYIYSRILLVLISKCCIEFNHYKTWIYSITVFYNTLKLNHIILYHIWYLQHDETTVLYIFQNTPSIVSACCIEFNRYKTRIYCITVFYCTLKRNHIILYHIWYLLHDEPTVLYIFQYIPSIDFKMLYWI